MVAVLLQCVHDQGYVDSLNVHELMHKLEQDGATLHPQTTTCKCARAHTDNAHMQRMHAMTHWKLAEAWSERCYRDRD